MRKDQRYAAKHLVCEAGNVTIPRHELNWIAEQYDDHMTAVELAQRLYDVSCTAKKYLSANSNLQTATASPYDLKGLEEYPGE